MNTLWIRRLFWTKESSYLNLVTPRFTKYWSQNCQSFKKLKNVILCVVTDIGTILAKFHSCFFIDIGSISMFFEISLSDSSGFPGACLFQNWHLLEVQICKIILLNYKYFHNYLMFLKYPPPCRQAPVECHNPQVRFPVLGSGILELF